MQLELMEGQKSVKLAGQQESELRNGLIVAVSPDRPCESCGHNL
jgi:hypothetical protein